MMDVAEEETEAERLELEAQAWVRRLVSGEATAADGEALRRWCKMSPAHAAAFSAASQLWEALGPASQSLPDSIQVIGDRRSVDRKSLIGRRAVIGGALAASAAGVMIARPPFDMWPSWSELRASYRTSAGEQREIALIEGVSVQMNSRTSLSMSGGDNSGVFNLIAGEVSVAVSDRVDRPCQVRAGGGRVSAINARFDMRVLEDGACVTCLADRIEVEYGGRSATLGAQQQIKYGSNGLGSIVAIDPTVVTAWQKGLMIFHMTPLSEVVEELNRYRSGRIVLLNSDIARIPVNGRFRIDRPDEALTQLERAFGVRRRTLPGDIILLG